MFVHPTCCNSLSDPLLSGPPSKSSRYTSFSQLTLVGHVAAHGADVRGTAPSSHNDSTKVISGPTATNGKTPPRDRGGVFRGSAGDGAPAEHPRYNVQADLEFRRNCRHYRRVAGTRGQLGRCNEGARQECHHLRLSLGRPRPITRRGFSVRSRRTGNNFA